MPVELLNNDSANILKASTILVDFIGSFDLVDFIVSFDLVDFIGSFDLVDLVNSKSTRIILKMHQRTQKLNGEVFHFIITSFTAAIHEFRSHFLKEHMVENNQFSAYNIRISHYRTKV